MKQVLLLVCFSWSSLCLNAAINPIYKECMQRGYSVDGDYCIFPDSTQCLLTEFNKKTCGQKWLTEDYCVEKGEYVWDSDKCCEGLIAYLPRGISGQATCQKKKGPSFWVISLVIGLLIAMLFFLKTKSRRRTS